jgi:hypothetical protein
VQAIYRKIPYQYDGSLQAHPSLQMGQSLPPLLIYSMQKQQRERLVLLKVQDGARLNRSLKDYLVGLLVQRAH